MGRENGIEKWTCSHDLVFNKELVPTMFVSTIKLHANDRTCKDRGRMLCVEDEAADVVGQPLTPSPHFPYPKTYEAAKDDTVVIVHTSGTTNTPKVVRYSHAFAASYTRSVQQAPPEGYMNLLTLFQSGRSFITFPFFHVRPT